MTALPVLAEAKGRVLNPPRKKKLQKAISLKCGLKSAYLILARLPGRRSHELANDPKPHWLRPLCAVQDCHLQGSPFRMVVKSKSVVAVLLGLSGEQVFEAWYLFEEDGN